ncbi:MAG: phosphoribosyltransferase [Lewinellaceae bacterium]|nr:phosphoribosyltransferase [Saprospiraceae bacterium]MCB9338672.1 phosphoribosyltransferase [Lewinellaceae bacterium]
MKILSDRQIRQKIRRLAIEIAEHNFDEAEIILAGINNAGTAFASLLQEQLREFSNLEITLTRIILNPADPLGSGIKLEMPLEGVKGKVIIVVDDVANTGRTIFYACKPLMETLPKKIEVAVLVDRTHKSFPIQVDYVGLSLATTLLEHIDVQMSKVEEFGVFLN